MPFSTPQQLVDYWRNNNWQGTPDELLTATIVVFDNLPPGTSQPTGFTREIDAATWFINNHI
jgi:hypothetical protein